MDGARLLLSRISEVAILNWCSCSQPPESSFKSVISSTNPSMVHFTQQLIKSGPSIRVCGHFCRCMSGLYSCQRVSAGFKSTSVHMSISGLKLSSESEHPIRSLELVTVATAFIRRDRNGRNQKCVNKNRINVKP